MEITLDFTIDVIYTDITKILKQIGSGLMLIAHRNPDTGEIQPLSVHSFNAARMCGEACEPVGLGRLGYLTGLLHDCGKAQALAQRRIMGLTDERVNHSSAGMRWLMERAAKGSASKYLAAQMAATAIGCHHGVRCDMVSPLGHEDWRDKIHSESVDRHYADCVQRFFGEVISEGEAETLLAEAGEEVRELYKKLNRLFPAEEQRSFALGFAQRLLFSALVDADWADTAGFMDGLEPPGRTGGEERAKLWEELFSRGEEHIGALPDRHPIDAMRRELSESCRDSGADAKPGSYRLCLPTGAGKTYAGLRFCLNAAKSINARHVFYFAPFKSITGQNAARIREVIGPENVLEHHSDFIVETGGEAEYQMYSGRWEGKSVICSTSVQLLDTLFAAPRRNVRRMASLAGSVLLFDEVQALPLRHTYLFNLAVNTLAALFGCVIVLCTATQPALAELKHPLMLSENCDIVPAYRGVFEKLKRVSCDVSRCRHGAMTVAELAVFVGELSEEHRSALVVMNTKSAAVELYSELGERLENGVHLFCLTTRMCSAHRKDVIAKLEALLDSGERVVCVSTQLIEAGVDLSFDCAVRSMAGLVNAVQTGGRSNRHGGEAMGALYIVDCSENLSRLKEIGEAKEAMRRLLECMPEDTDWLSVDAMDRYFELLYSSPAAKEEMEYRHDSAAGSVSLVDLLTVNEQGMRAIAGAGNPMPPKFTMHQAFGTAEGAFEAISDEKLGVLVPYADGEGLIARLLSGERTPELFRQLETYTVQLGDGELRKLGGAIAVELDGAVKVLLGNYYDAKGPGVVFDPLPLNAMFQ